MNNKNKKMGTLVLLALLSLSLLSFSLASAQTETPAPPTPTPIEYETNPNLILTSNITKTLDWGRFNTTSSQVVNLTNHGESAIDLNFTIVHPTIRNLTEYISLTSDYNGTALQPLETRTINFTVTRTNFDLTQDFSFGINVSNLLVINTTTLTLRTAMFDVFSFVVVIIVFIAVIAVVFLIAKKVGSAL